MAATDSEHLDMLARPVGEPGSGRLRYAAAMHFYNRGMIDARLLEIFRICAKLDGEDPVRVARLEGVETKALTHLMPPAGR